MLHKKKKKEEFKDLGFGNKVTGDNRRLINKNGTFNVIRKGQSFAESVHIYHTLLTMSWLRFSGFILLSYFIVNVLFALIYYFVGVENLLGVIAKTELEKMMESFFFSAQTLTTVGYGRISPIGFVSSSVAALESMSGLLGFAFITGLLYGRFSKPESKIMYSTSALVAPFKENNALMFRLANQRKEQLIELEVQLTLSRVEEKNGQKLRQFYTLELERSKINFLVLTWTIVHPIDENSPLYLVTKEELIASEAEFMVTLKAFDESFSQNVFSRTSYRGDEVIWGAKFTNIYNPAANGSTVLELDRFNETENVPLNVSVLQEAIAE